MDEVLLSPADLAKYLNVPVSTVYGWNYRKSGPRTIKIGGHIRYRMSDVQDWLVAHERAS